MAEKKRPKSADNTARPTPSRPRSIDSSLRFEYLIAAVVMALGVCVLYAEMIFGGQVFFGGDSQAAASFAEVGKEAMSRGVYPVWNPYIYSGMPSFGSLSYTPNVYPVNYLIWVLRKIFFFPHYTWLFFHTWLMGFAVYLLLRDRRVHWSVAMAAGTLMMWMPNLVAVGAHGHGSQAIASAFIPLALLFWDRLWRGGSVVLNASALAIVLGCSMLRGHLQISYYTYLLIGLHFLFFGVMRIADGIRGVTAEHRLMPGRARGASEKLTTGRATGEVMWMAALLVLIVVASVLMSSSLYGPVRDYAQYSIRGASAAGGLDYDYATSWSLHPVESLTFIFPYALGFGKDLYFGWMPFTDYPNYVGVILAMFAVVALIRSRARFVRFLAFVALVTTIISFGRFFPVLYNPLFELLPYFDKFRVPVMILIVQQVSVVLLFGVGLDAMLRTPDDRGKKIAVQGLAAAFLLFMIVVLTQGAWSGEFADSIKHRIRGASNAQQQLLVAKVAGTYLRNDLMRLAMMVAGVFVILFVYFNSRRVPVLVAVGLLGILGLTDFYLVDRHILHPERWRQHEAMRIIHPASVADQYTTPDAVVNFLRRDTDPFRVFPMDSPQQPFGSMFYSNQFMNFGIASIGGYHAAKLSHYDAFLRTALPGSLSRGNFQVVDMLHARYLVTGAPLPEHPRFESLWEGTDAEGRDRFVYSNRGAFPHAWLIGSYQVADDEGTLNALTAATVDLSSTVLLDRQPASAPVPGVTGTALVTQYDFNEVTVSVDASAPAVMVLSEIYYPDWKVTVDGAPAEMLRANYLLRGVSVPAGQHEVKFVYDWSLIRKCFLVSRVTLGVLLLLVVMDLLLHRRRKRGVAHLHSHV